MLYHELHQGPQEGQNYHWEPWPPLAPLGTAPDCVVRRLRDWLTMSVTLMLNFTVTTDTC